MYVVCVCSNCIIVGEAVIQQKHKGESKSAKGEKQQEKRSIHTESIEILKEEKNKGKRSRLLLFMINNNQKEKVKRTPKRKSKTKQMRKKPQRVAKYEELVEF